MASFQKMTRGALDKNTAIEGTGIANVPKKGTGGGGKVAGSSTVGGTGDNAAKSGTGGKVSLTGSASVGGTGDNVPKRGTGA